MEAKQIVPTPPPFQPPLPPVAPQASELKSKILRCWEGVKGHRSVSVEEARAALSDIVAYTLSPHEANDPTIETIYKLSNFLLLKKPKLSKEEAALLERLQIYAELQTSAAERERILASPETFYRSPINKEYLAKWKSCKYPLEALLWNPTIPKFIFEGHLHHKMKAYGMVPHYVPETHEFQIMVDGKYTNAAVMAELLTTKEEQLLGHRSHFLVAKHNETETWNFLPEVGLTKWQDREWKRLKPIAHLSKEQVAYAQKRAHLSASDPKSEPLPFVVEIVGSWNAYREYPLISGYQETFSGKHPWIRLIDARTGDLYSLGFGVGANISPLQPTTVVDGVFRSPDPWETISCTGRPVTGFGLTAQQFDELKGKIEEAQNKKVYFNFIEHNCTKFIEWVVHTYGPENSKNVSFSADLSEIIYRMLPRSARKGAEVATGVTQGVKKVTYQFIPPIIKDSYKFFTAALRMLVERIIMMVSGRWFVYDKQKEFSDEKVDPHAGIPWYRFIQHAQIACKDHLIRAFLPRKMYEWQLRQRSTMIYPAGTTLYDHYREAK